VEKAMASKAVATMAVMVASERVTAEQGMFVSGFSRPSTMLKYDNDYRSTATKDRTRTAHGVLWKGFDFDGERY
jgi:hypothetical protein